MTKNGMELRYAEPMQPANEEITIMCEERMLLCVAQLEEYDYLDGKVVKSWSFKRTEAAAGRNNARKMYSKLKQASEGSGSLWKKIAEMTLYPIRQHPHTAWLSTHSFTSILQHFHDVAKSSITSFHCYIQLQWRHDQYDAIFDEFRVWVDFQ